MKEFLKQCVARFEALETDLNRLDAATGDGDHGATMLKGLRAAADADDTPAKAFRMAAGGASGTLFAQVIRALEKAVDGAPLGEALANAAARIEMLGQAKEGDKTMLDALLPASRERDPAAAAKAADAGRVASKPLAAKRGRASHVEGAGVGHIDAGATSVAELLRLYAAWDKT